MDRIDTQRRSWNMSRIPGKNTTPEKVVRSLLHGMGFRFRIHVKNLPGRPDIVLPRWKVVVLVHGCFWHRHKKCQFAYTPKSRTEFWLSKFDGNVRRDRRTLALLRKAGWKPIVVWECETRDLKRLARRLKQQIVLRQRVTRNEPASW